MTISIQVWSESLYLFTDISFGFCPTLWSNPKFSSPSIAWWLPTPRRWPRRHRAPPKRGPPGENPMTGRSLEKKKKKTLIWVIVFESKWYKIQVWRKISLNQISDMVDSNIIVWTTSILFCVDYFFKRERILSDFLWKQKCRDMIEVIWLSHKLIIDSIFSMCFSLWTYSQKEPILNDPVLWKFELLLQQRQRFWDEERAVVQWNGGNLAAKMSIKGRCLFMNDTQKRV